MTDILELAKKFGVISWCEDMPKLLAFAAALTKEKDKELEQQIVQVTTERDDLQQIIFDYRKEVNKLEEDLNECQIKLAARMLVRPIDIDQMVTNFLNWRLPENFHPDAGISFTPDYNVETPYPQKHEPVSTNLFSADQAKQMILAILPKSEVSTDRIREMIAAEKAPLEEELSTLRTRLNAWEGQEPVAEWKFGNFLHLNYTELNPNTHVNLFTAPKKED